MSSSNGNYSNYYANERRSRIGYNNGSSVENNGSKYQESYQMGENGPYRSNKEVTNESQSSGKSSGLLNTVNSNPSHKHYSNYHADDKQSSNRYNNGHSEDYSNYYDDNRRSSNENNSGTSRENNDSKYWERNHMEGNGQYTNNRGTMNDSQLSGKSSGPLETVNSNSSNSHYSNYYVDGEKNSNGYNSRYCGENQRSRSDRESYQMEDNGQYKSNRDDNRYTSFGPLNTANMNPSNGYDSNYYADDRIDSNRNNGGYSREFSNYHADDSRSSNDHNRRSSNNNSGYYEKNNRTDYSESYQMEGSYKINGDGIHYQIGNNMINHLSNEIRNSYRSNRQVYEEQVEKVQMARRIESILGNPEFRLAIYNAYGFVYHRIVIFGSSVTKLATVNSDLDLCIVWEGRWEKGIERDVLGWVDEQLVKHFDNVKFISDAQVPIIRIRAAEHEIDIAVSVGGFPPLCYKLISLINCYSKINHRFTVLCSFVRRWFTSFSQREGMTKREASRFIPNSYSTTLLVIYFMQKQGLLPNLYQRFPDFFQPDIENMPEGPREEGKFEAQIRTNSYKFKCWWSLKNWHFKNCPLDKEDIIGLRKETFHGGNENARKSVGVLFVDFLVFYTSVVKLSRNNINTSEAISIPRDNEDIKKLFIKDKFDRKNPGRSTIEAISIEKIMEDALGLIEKIECVDDVMDKLWNIEIPEKTELPDFRGNKEFVPAGFLSSDVEDEDSD